jgi:serine/threonine protein kinase/nucleoside phosphorylase
MKRPTTFGKYLLLERINVGGMAEVFIAKAFGVEGFEHFLAIKKILPTMAEDQELITMFIDEARINVQLNHANVVHIHEFGKYDETYFIVMEYVAGRDLRIILERYRRRKEIMPTAQAVFIASKMCEGLDYVHRKRDARGQELGIIHRDVSPQNILVSYEGEVKIIDFGFAKVANRSQKTQADILMGRFGYMSPEQVRGMPIDRRSDIFAVGVILYEMLTGEKLFVGESDFSTLEKVRDAEVPLPRQFNPNVPSGLEKVVLKALAREPEDRYQWASDLQEDLMRFLLAGDAIYSGKHLSSYMKEAFAEDMLREAEKMERYAIIEKPGQFENSGMGSMQLQSNSPVAASVGPPPVQVGRSKFEGQALKEGKALEDEITAPGWVSIQESGAVGQPVPVARGNEYLTTPETLATGPSYHSPLSASDAVDVVILTVIQPELFAALAALGIPDTAKKRSSHGTVYFRGSLRSHLAGRDYQLAVTCIGAAGNYDASAAVAEVIAEYRPRLVLLMGIAAGVRGKVRIGEVVLSERVVAYEPAAVIASQDGRSSHIEHRPESDRLHHAVNQDVVTYRPSPTRLAERFRHVGGRYPASPAGKREEFLENVASRVAVRTATIASGEKLLRDPAKLLAVRREQHGKVEVGEMEAAGLVAACRRASIPWLVIRGISDFGDAFKDDQFHGFASRAAATVLADFLAHGLDVAPLGAGIIPHYPDGETRRLSLKMENARERKHRLQAAGASTAEVDREIINLRRQLREGGQLRAGDSLGENGRFLLIEPVGQGGFAHIWKAIDRAQGEPKTVAIKVLHTNLAGDEQRRERFFRGARIMTELRHPAVVRVIERQCKDGGYYYFVMEYIAGGNFREAVLKKELSPDQVIAIILRISEALALAHSRGFIHRDIKPANILLDGQRQALLTDFDLVSARDTTGGTRTGAMGTIVYAAPECLSRPQDADQRADVYGLGMTAVFGLHGADLPFHLFLKAQEVFLARLPCSQALKIVLSKAISLEPADRYKDASEFLGAVQQAEHEA